MSDTGAPAGETPDQDPDRQPRNDVPDPAQDSPGESGTPPGDAPETQPPDDTRTGAPGTDKAPQSARRKIQLNGSGKGRSDRPSRGGTVVVRYGLSLQTGEFRHNFDTPPTPGTKVVARTERGVELGEVIAGIQSINTGCHRCLSAERLEAFLRDSGPEYPFRRGGRILRLANHQDIIDHRHLQNSACEEARFCREHIRRLGVDMKLVTVEHLLGGERIIFYFASEERVDFRELVRHLAGQYRTRIEMRQVGARDEARLVGDYERCGQQCCCQSFLKNLKPVSMRMAKTQKATLDPSKISGRCGRLMCCLRYEDEGYTDLRKKLPKKNTWVRTEQLLGRVIDTQIITQMVRVALPNNTQAVIHNDQIVERDVSPPPATAPTPGRTRTSEASSAGSRRNGKTSAPRKASPVVAEARQSAAPAPQESPAPEVPDETSQAKPLVEGEQPSETKRRRRHPSRKSPGAQPAQSSASDRKPEGKADSTQGDSAAKKKRRRRRRKKRKKPGQSSQ